MRSNKLYYDVVSTKLFAVSADATTESRNSIAISVSSVEQAKALLESKLSKHDIELLFSFDKDPCVVINLNVTRSREYLEERGFTILSFEEISNYFKEIGEDFSKLKDNILYLETTTGKLFLSPQVLNSFCTEEIAVEVNSLQEWEHVIKVKDYKLDLYGGTYGHPCINLTRPAVSSKDIYLTKGYHVISFEEFLQMYPEFHYDKTLKESYLPDPVKLMHGNTSIGLVVDDKEGKIEIYRYVSGCSLTISYPDYWSLEEAERHAHETIRRLEDSH